MGRAERSARRAAPAPPCLFGALHSRFLFRLCFRLLCTIIRCAAPRVLSCTSPPSQGPRTLLNLFASVDPHASPGPAGASDRLPPARACLSRAAGARAALGGGTFLRATRPSLPSPPSPSQPPPRPRRLRLPFDTATIHSHPPPCMYQHFHPHPPVPRKDEMTAHAPLCASFSPSVSLQKKQFPPSLSAPQERRKPTSREIALFYFGGDGSFTHKARKARAPANDVAASGRGRRKRENRNGGGGWRGAVAFAAERTVRSRTAMRRGGGVPPCGAARRHQPPDTRRRRGVRRR